MTNKRGLAMTKEGILTIFISLKRETNKHSAMIT